MRDKKAGFTNELEKIFNENKDIFKKHPEIGARNLKKLKKLIQEI